MVSQALIGIAVAIIAFTVTFAVIWAVVIPAFEAPNTLPTASPKPGSTAIAGPSASSTPPNLSPARDLEGTWKTSFATTFYIKTDFSSATLEDVGTQDRMMTWVITNTADENVVNIEVSFTTSNTQLVSGSGYVPDVSPMFLTGTISGTRLTLTSNSDGTVGTFNFTTDILTGTWNDNWTIAYSQQVYTATNGLVLMRQ